MSRWNEGRVTDVQLDSVQWGGGEVDAVLATARSAGHFAGFLHCADLGLERELYI